MSTITKLSPEVIQYYNNIISLMRKCESTKDIQIYERYERELTYKYTRKSASMNRKRALTSLLKGNSRGIQGAWKDVALDGRLEIHATAAPL